MFCILLGKHVRQVQIVCLCLWLGDFGLNLISALSLDRTKRLLSPRPPGPILYYLQTLLYATIVDYNTNNKLYKL